MLFTYSFFAGLPDVLSCARIIAANISALPISSLAVILSLSTMAPEMAENTDSRLIIIDASVGSHRC